MSRTFGSRGQGRPARRSPPRPRSPTAWSTSGPTTASCTPSRSAATRRRDLHAALDGHHRRLRSSTPRPRSPTASSTSGSDDGKLYAFAVGCDSGGGTCTPLWTATTGDAINSSPAVADGVVYVGSGDGKLYAFAVGCNSGGGTCTPLWTGATGGVISSPAVADGVVYVGSWTASCMPSRSAATAAAGPARRSGRAPPAGGSSPRPRSPTAWSTSGPRTTGSMPSPSAAAAAAEPARRSGSGDHRQHHRILAGGRGRRGLRRVRRPVRLFAFAVGCAAAEEPARRSGRARPAT